MYLPCHAPPPRPAPGPLDDPAPPLPLPRVAAIYKNSFVSFDFITQIKI